jgi:hypothetical protein
MSESGEETILNKSEIKKMIFLKKYIRYERNDSTINEKKFLQEK